ncbi:M20 family metallopeptidase [Tersicoccus sp. Bi-70]|uniref:M20 family metallopeptidase n=1 Tax=Tersicoccus sp. Bi-70 TaxID=1897634 RepID=UPI0009770DEF|nr:M20 family metallopeptidase [Tersicoccus sp. Bi-70]OMH35015.1 peptidase M20 [Tersicoccus sp. Bi-70]
MSEAQVIGDAIGPQRAAMLRTLEDYVELETPSDRPDLLAAALPRIEQLIADVVGPAADRQVTEPDGHGPNLTLDLPGTTDRWVTALCHYDTVWSAGSLEQWPFTVEDDVARGPGIFDMKAGLVQLIYALRLLDDLGLDRPHVRLLLNGDEEVGSPSSRPLIEATVQRTDGPVLVFEASAGEAGDLKTERKGVGIFALDVTGKEAHAGLDPTKGVSAIDEMARLILKVHALTDLDAGTTVNVGIVSGGTRTNVFAGAAHADIDVRVRSQAELDRVDAALKALTTHHPDATVTLSGDWNRPVMPRTDAGGRLFELARQAGADLGQDIGQTSVGGASDGNFAVGVGAAVLDGFGAVGDGAHARHEHIRVSGMLDRTALAALVLHRLA